MALDYGGEPAKAKLDPEHVVLPFISTISVPYWYSRVFYFPSNEFAAAFPVKTWALTGGQ